METKRSKDRDCYVKTLPSQEDLLTEPQYILFDYTEDDGGHQKAGLKRKGLTLFGKWLPKKSTTSTNVPSSSWRPTVADYVPLIKKYQREE